MAITDADVPYRRDDPVSFTHSSWFRHREDTPSWPVEYKSYSYSERTSHATWPSFPAISSWITTCWYEIPCATFPSFDCHVQRRGPCPIASFVVRILQLSPTVPLSVVPLVHNTKMFRWPSSRHPFSIRDIGSWTDNKDGSAILHPSFADVSQPRLPSLWPSRMLSLHSSSPAIPNTADCVSHPININIKLNWIVAESPKEMALESKRTHQGYCMICRACSLSALSYCSNPLTQSVQTSQSAVIVAAESALQYPWLRACGSPTRVYQYLDLCHYIYQ
ncbi:hypothetical protein EDD15DRAFT_1198528 [Pisolithus albus]|nr:hypothetical protein EDD15DRAFT_1198528 [Pisolithus albus]